MLQQATLMKLIGSPRKKRTAANCGRRRGIIWEEEGSQQEQTREDDGDRTNIQ